MIINKTIVISINNRNKNYYKNLGYNINNKKIKIKTNDLKKGSHLRINVECVNCKNISNIKFVDYNKITNNDKEKYYCKDCKFIKIKKTNLKKYGVENVFQNKEIKKKIKKTNNIKYNADYPMQNNIIKNKSKKTNLNRYGVEYPTQNKEIMNKIKKTNNIKYNYDFFILTEKSKEIIKEKYKTYHISKNSEIKKKIKETKNNNIIYKYIKRNIDIIKISGNNYKIKCVEGHIYDISSTLLYHRLKYNILNPCTKCYPVNSYDTSNKEKQLITFIKDNYNNILINDRHLNKELDIYIPELKLAFEFNGVWWHNELHKNKNYHLNKTELCEKNGIQLIHIWEDDWIYKQDIIKSMILNKLNKITNKINETRICEINNNKLIRKFLERNHIDGYIRSKVRIGLFNKNELVSLMVFSKNKNNYNLLRFCDKLNINVINSESKLFNYFIDKYKPKKINTYIDRSWDDGKLYYDLGFEYSGKTTPDYHYIVDGVKKSKNNYKKDKLVKEGYNPQLTEQQIMLNRKIYRIYNSGRLILEY